MWLIQMFISLINFWSGVCMMPFYLLNGAQDGSHFLTVFGIVVIVADILQRESNASARVVQQLFTDKLS